MSCPYCGGYNSHEKNCQGDLLENLRILAKDFLNSSCDYCTDNAESSKLRACLKRLEPINKEFKKEIEDIDYCDMNHAGSGHEWGGVYRNNQTRIVHAVCKYCGVEK